MVVCELFFIVSDVKTSLEDVGGGGLVVDLERCFESNLGGGEVLLFVIDLGKF